MNLETRQATCTKDTIQLPKAIACLTGCRITTDCAICPAPYSSGPSWADSEISRVSWTELEPVGFRCISALRCDARPHNLRTVVGYNERDGIVALSEWLCYTFDGLTRRKVIKFEQLMVTWIDNRCYFRDVGKEQ